MDKTEGCSLTFLSIAWDDQQIACRYPHHARSLITAVQILPSASWKTWKRKYLFCLILKHMMWRMVKLHLWRRKSRSSLCISNPFSSDISFPAKGDPTGVRLRYMCCRKQILSFACECHVTHTVTHTGKRACGNSGGKTTWNHLIASRKAPKTPEISVFGAPTTLRNQ